jgi:hypothetical protein
MIRRCYCAGLVSGHANKWDCLRSAGAEGVRSGIINSVIPTFIDVSVIQGL